MLLAAVTHARGQIEQATDDAAQSYLLAQLDQQEAALDEYDEQIKAKLNQD